jgi:Site-specific recombinase XerD
VFKVIYGWGLRRTETAKLDLADWGRNPAAPEFGRHGMLHVRYGKAVRGQPPRRRNVPSVMGWAVEAVADYVDNIRPRFGRAEHRALWVTERGGRIKPAEINARFVAYRDALGLPKALSPHSLRHSFAMRLLLSGVDVTVIALWLGHEQVSTTSIYLHADMSQKERAIARTTPPNSTPGRYRAPDAVLAFLEAL